MEPEWLKAVAAVRTARRVVLACHLSPDGDALGSMLGAALGLRRLDIDCQATFPSPFEVPAEFRAMPGLDLLVPPDQTDSRPDLLICFDVASIRRLGDLAGRVDSAGEVLVIDHHLSNTGFGTIHLIEPDAAATAVVVERLLTRLGVPLDPQIAECLYIALSTDTGSFRYQATTPEVHSFAARLLATGISHHEISRRLYDTRPLGALRVLGDALSRLVVEPDAVGGQGLAWTYATLTDLTRHQVRPYVMEGLIEVVRTLDEADVVCVFKQVGPDAWAASLRSKGAVDVSAAAAILGGGGHRFAAGFTRSGTVAEILVALRSALAAGDLLKT